VEKPCKFNMLLFISGKALKTVIKFARKPFQVDSLTWLNRVGSVILILDKIFCHSMKWCSTRLIWDWNLESSKGFIFDSKVSFKFLTKFALNLGHDVFFFNFMFWKLTKSLQT